MHLKHCGILNNMLIFKSNQGLKWWRRKRGVCDDISTTMAMTRREMLLGPDAALLAMYGVGTLDRFFYGLARFLTMLVRFDKPVIVCDLGSCFARNCWLFFRVT